MSNPNEVGTMTDAYAYFLLSLNSRLEEKQITQKELAQNTGRTKTYISLIANGHRKASDDVQGQIAAALHTTVRNMIEEGYKLSGDNKSDSRLSDVDPIAVISDLVNELRSARDEVLRMNTIIENIGEGIGIFNKDTICIYQNRKAREMFGRNIVGLTANAIIEGTKLKMVDHKERAVIACFKSKLEERAVFSLPDQKSCITAVATPIMSRDGQIFEVVAIYTRAECANFKGDSKK